MKAADEIHRKLSARRSGEPTTPNP